MKKTEEFIATIQAEIEKAKMYKQIEKEESNRQELITVAELEKALWLTQYAIAEAKKARTDEEALFWSEMADRHSILYFKIKQYLEKKGS